MERGSKDAVGTVWLKEGEVWKFGTTINPTTRYSLAELQRIGTDGVKYVKEFSGALKEAIELQNMKIRNFLVQEGVLPAGNNLIKLEACVMRLFITSDADWESRIDQSLTELSKLNYRDYFNERNYGAGLLGISVGFICHDSALNLKRRIRLSKKDKTLYMDIVLDLPTMKSAKPEFRKKTIAECLSGEIPEILSKYKIDDFDQNQFVVELRTWISNTGWLAMA